MARLLQYFRPVSRTNHQTNRAGFTLIEIMIVVAIIGILAALAIPLFNRYIRRTKTTEVEAMFQQIRLKQEQYYGFFGRYAASEGWYPAAVGHQKTLWAPGDDSSWVSLGVAPQSRYVQFQYRVFAGNAGTAPTDDNAIDSTRDWWYAQARGDLDGDGTLSFFEITSQRQEIFRENPLE